jgi:tetratricopeptide (TPR) repeat protein
MRPLTLSVFLLLAHLFVPNAYSQTGSRDMKKEAAIWDELRSVNPEVLDAFKQGTVQLDAGNYKAAAASYQKVVDSAPNFDPGLRRLGICLSLTGNVQLGLPLLEKAVTIKRSPENLSTLAQYLAFPGSAGAAPRPAQERALSLVQEANQKNSKPDPTDLFLTAQIAGTLDNETEFRKAARQMIDNFPELAASHYLNALRAAADERWTEAENEILRAKQLGFPPDVVQHFLDSGVHRQASVWRYAGYAVIVTVAWIAGLGLLFILGKALSALTLSSIEHSGKSSDVVTSNELTLRKVYRKLIQVAGWYYYVSLPFVVVLLIVAAGTVVYAFMALGRIPVRLVAILAIVTLGTIYKMVQSLFVKIKAEDPGRSLTPEEAPGLWTLTGEVAADVGTRKVDDIRITLGTDVAVYEKGTQKEKSQDRAKRILILGVGVLDGFRVQPFRAVLAHEYGHFTNRDTAGGDIAIRVNNDMMKFAYAMARAGHAVAWNLGFQFVRIYHFLFRRISHGASRLQEVLADRTAVLKYGADAFEEGLTHAIRRSVEFPFAANREITVAVDAGRALHNLYGLPVEGEKSVEEEIEKSLNRATSEDDTHPSPVDRFRLARQLGAEPRPADSAMVWDLFQNRETLTMEMTALIDSSIERGVRVPESAVPTFREVDL